jgi:hypothetical protein
VLQSRLNQTDTSKLGRPRAARTSKRRCLCQRSQGADIIVDGPRKGGPFPLLLFMENCCAVRLLLELQACRCAGVQVCMHSFGRMHVDVRFAERTNPTLLYT